MKRKVEWTLGDGRAASVTVELVTERKVYGVPESMGRATCCEITETGEVEGVRVGTWVCRSMKPQGAAVAACGKLGITRENLDRIDAAVAELKATPEWVAHEAAETARKAELDADDNSYARISRAMEG